MNSVQILKNNIEIHRNDVFISDEFLQYTYNETIEIASKYFSFFDEIGLKKGDKIIVISENSLCLAFLYIACLGYGITVVPISPDYKITQIDQFISITDPNAVFISKKNKEINVSLNDIDKYIFERHFFINNDNFYDANKNIIKSQFFLADVDSKDDLLIVYTSGTTSTPKGVIHTYESIISNALAFGDIFDLSTTNKFINYLPMTYLGGYYNLLMLPFINSCQVFISEIINPLILTNFWSLIYRNKINTIWFVPSILSMLLKLDRELKVDLDINDNKLCFVGTAPLPLELKTRFEERYGLKLYENYGLSETLFISTQTTDKISNLTNVGKLLDGVYIRINKFSEIEVETPSIMRGYQTKDNGIVYVKNKYFKTGDIGLLHTNYNNLLSVIDRKKNIIIRGGININPVLIENLIYTNKNIYECSVIGVQSEFTGEDIVVFLSIPNSKDHDKIIEEVKVILEANLAKYQLPSKYIIIDEFPKTVSGKINKNKLCKLLND